jgi:hypothetical protein
METKSIPEYVWVVVYHTCKNNPIMCVYVDENEARGTYEFWKSIAQTTANVTITQTYLYS